jgi:hypothetical protein
MASLYQWQQPMEESMRNLFAVSVIGLGLMIIAEPALAQSCYDLWYERNAIYNDRGYCFATDLGIRTFDNSDCWTHAPRFTKAERRRIEQIKREEEDRGCQVN